MFVIKIVLKKASFSVDMVVGMILTLCCIKLMIKETISDAGGV